MPETDALSAIDHATERLVAALEKIATDHGSEAVDLALASYRVDAIKDLGVGFFVLILAVGLVGNAIWCAVHCSRHGWFIEDGHVWERDGAVPTVGTSFFAFISAGFGIMFAAIAIDHLWQPAKWLAAFGSPEILIATNVLKSAGLL